MKPESENLEIRVLKDYDSMCQSFPLIQQLNPSMTRGRYLDLIREMVKLGTIFRSAAFCQANWLV